MSESQGVDARIHRWLRQHSILLLRLALGIVFFAFGLLKFFPGVSPAEALSEKTMDALTFGLVAGDLARLFVATLECAIGLLLLSGRGTRLVVYLLVVALVGILAPLVLFPGRLFAGPHGAPTLEGQYVLKDVILVAAGFVVASTAPGLVPGADPERSKEEAEEATDDGEETPEAEWTDDSAVRVESGR